MTATEPDDGMCHETSGFLFSHQCDRFAMQKCFTCQKPLCEEHGHLVTEGTLCTTCLKRKVQAARANRNDDSFRDSRYDHYYDNDPYFYGSRYYPGYGHHTVITHHDHGVTQTHSSAMSDDGNPRDDDNTSGGDVSFDPPAHDPADFTEGDSESLRHEEDADFETDMGAS